ncbi:MAG: DNA polymerase I [Acidimicrobiia bacterium]
MANYLLLDGNSLTYRAFFALPTDMATASGQVTNAVFGFTSMLINLMRDHQPDGVMVAFDRPEPTFRHEANPAYKAQREAAPDILRQQMGLVRQVVDTLGITVSELPGWEADDLLATVATRLRDRGDSVIIVTGDRDAYQLVQDPAVRVLYNRRGVSDYALYDEAGIVERTGVTPTLYPQYAALRGDPSDNLPGVPGVGEKTAAKLISTYGGIDGIYAHLDELTPKVRENLAANEAQVRMNHELMVVRRDVPMEIDLDHLDVGPFDPTEVKRLFDFLEFKSLLDRLNAVVGQQVGGASAASDAGHVLEAEKVEWDRSALSSLTTCDMAPAWTGDPGRSALAGVAIVIDAATAEVMWCPAEQLELLTDLLATSPVRAHNAKAMIRALIGHGVDVRHLTLDTAIAAYLIDPADSRYDLGDVLTRYTGDTLPTSGVPEGQLALGGDAIDPVQQACREALAVARLAPALLDALDRQGMATLNRDVEVPLVRVLARMEHLGVRVDIEALRALNSKLTAEVARLTSVIHADAGKEFNVNSTLQLREILFDQLGLTPGKKTKTGYSTDAQSLEKMLGEHPIIEHLLAYREVEKLRSTYGTGLLAEVAPDGRIHATFNQTVARTGRLSSDQPNLHNIPVRSEEGRVFRTAFIPSDGNVFIVADYNQIELRCIAHLAQDPGLIAAFTGGRDVHTETASRIFGVEAGAVSVEQRSKSKMVSYGLAYGMEAYGLGQRLGIATSEADAILKAYFEAFPAVKDYMDRTVAEARSRGYTETLYGRRRPIPELSSPNFRIRQAGERQAMNAGIQGLAADVFKVALIRLDDALEAGGFTSRIVLQVHDEIVVDAVAGEQEAVAALTEQTMRGAAELSVPLEVNISIGSTWAAAKG